MLIDRGKDWEEFMFRMCIPKRRKQEHASNKTTATTPKSRRSSAMQESSRSATEVDTSGISTFDADFTTSKENQSKESQATSSSSNTTTSSLAGIRELFRDGPVIYRYKELVKATDNFSDTFRIGQSVYRGTVRRTDIAIVRKKGSFASNYVDLIKTIANIHHINIVKLLGACLRGEDDYVYICYEYEHGANLQDALHSTKAVGFSVLSKWTSRLRVALDIAQALEYLHDFTIPSFVHKHVKSTNILVTEDLRAKIAKFGVPQLIGEVQTEASEEKGKRLTRSNSVRITGTPGYMAPEYMSTGVVTSKVDVYAYGVVLLELLSGHQPGVQQDPVTKRLTVVSLPDSINEVIKSEESKKKLRLWMDPRLKDSYPVDVALSVAVLATQCVDSDPAARPQMKNVAAKLSGHLGSSLKWERDYLPFAEFQSQTMEGR